MSNAGRPSEREKVGNMDNVRNGDSPPVPPDLEWDPNNPPVIFACTQHTEHHSRCDGNCGEIVLDTELQVLLLNEARAYARAGMSFLGVPAAYVNHIPISGMAVELIDLLIWLEATKTFLIEKLGLTQEELDEKFREKKFNFMREVREAAEPGVRRNRAQQALGIVPKKLLGPDGTPLH